MLWLVDWSDLWTPRPVRHLLLWCLVPIAVAVVLPIASDWWARLPPSLVVRADRGEFRVPDRPVTTVGLLLLGFGLALCVVSTGYPSGGPLVVSALPMVVVVFVGALMAGTPDSLGLSPRGLWLRWGPRRPRWWTWEELADVTAEVMPPRRWWQRRAVTVRLRLPSQRRRLPWNGIEVDLPLSGVRVDPRFLATVIEYYRLHPEARAGIGTLDGYERLCAALAEWPVPATVPSHGGVDGAR